ncbi:DnaJ-like protein [Zancudomyces culisetae]|uniref:DnaJ-like protein n=1 Tax=Zancudomyces culisetae TaxID=1213189 RepID=A0A1R1PX22_ZANCU|nr:DnaJ-like protein [Zancudomyces culisetae]|eukprot:OMH85546.1 DnaJ-like protein [Zancudomyces culisetae]
MEAPALITTMQACGGNLTEFEAANTTAGFHGSGSGADNQEELEEYYRDLFSGAVDAASIEELSKAYIGSAEEYNDVVKAYLENNGDMNEILANCMFSEYDNANEHRYKSIIDRAIERNDIDKKSVGYTDIYKSTISTKETKARAKRARNEAKEAELLRIELGLDEKLKKVKKSAENKNGSGEDQGFDELKALIQLNKSKNKFDSFLDRLESKYSTPSSSSSSSKKKKGNKAGGSKTRK